MSTGIKGGLFWSFGERVVAQLVSTVVSVILARLLSPEHYGVISIVMVFIALCDIFTNSGMGRSIVRRKNADDLDYNTAFAIGLALSAVLYVIVYLGAPSIANFYEMPELTIVLRVMGVRLPIGAMNTLQHARVQREMRFRSYFLSTLFGTVLSGAIGIGMAYAGFGIWALVGQYLSSSIINTLVLLFTDRWFPKVRFSLTRAKEIFSFGWKVLATDLVFTLQTDIRSLIIGKVFGSADLAYFDQGKKYPKLLVDNVNKAINTVMLPAFSKVQDNHEELKRMLRKAVTTGIYVLTPILLGMAAVSDSFVAVVLTDKWMACSPYIKVFCLMFLTRPLETSCHQALLALGESGRVLKIMIIINIVGLLGVLVASFVFHSVFLIAISTLISTFVSVICFMYSISKRISYRWMEQLHDILPSILVGTVMYVGVSLLQKLTLAPIIMLCIQVVAGMAIYVACSIAFRIEAFNNVLAMVKGLAKRR